MAYRTLTVDGRPYQYSIGKSYTHVRHVGTFHHTDIGDTVRGKTDPQTGVDRFIVTPRCVANAIKGIHHPLEMWKSPFDGKIYQAEETDSPYRRPQKAVAPRA